jgi:hypothetical protein
MGTDNCLNDTAFLVYLYNVIVCFIGAVLFIWWWYKISIASEVYKYFTFLLLSLAFERSIVLYSRSLKLCEEPEILFNFVDGKLWSIRTLPSAIVLTLIVAMVIRRLHILFKNTKGEEK